MVTGIRSLLSSLAVVVLILADRGTCFSPGGSSLHYSPRRSRRPLWILQAKDSSSVFSSTSPLSDAERARTLRINQNLQFPISRRLKGLSVSSTRTFSLILKWWLRVRKVMASALFALMISSTLWCNSAAAGGTCGRMGGSFGPRQSSQPSAPSTISYPPSRYYHPSPCRRYRPHSHTVVPHSHTVVHHTLSPTAAYTIQVVLPVYMAAVTGVAVYSFTKSRVDSSRGHQSALGVGVSVASVTMALDVPDRDAYDSVLAKMKRLSVGAQTGTRRGVQDMITNVSLEMLRREKSIVSAASTYDHYLSSSEAQREFNRLSIQQRSKFDEETVNKFGGVDMGRREEPDPRRDDTSRATAAVVTITVSIEGDQTKIPTIRSRADLVSALSILASDVPVDDCLLSAEVLWAPESRSETLTKEDLIADYPELYPI